MKRTKKFLSLALALILMLSLLPAAAFARPTDDSKSVPEAFRGTWTYGGYTLVIGEDSCVAKKGNVTVTVPFTKMLDENKAQFFIDSSNKIEAEITQDDFGAVCLAVNGNIKFDPAVPFSEMFFGLFRAHSHTFADTYSSNATKHWFAATCGHDVKSGEGEHVDTDVVDHKCDVCGYVMSECIDENSDHFCDYEGCGDELSECVDENSDHYCDFAGCGDKLSECIDENNDHFCDFAGCGDKLSECKDENSDHYCDFAGCGDKLSECKDENNDHYCDFEGCGEKISECKDENNDHKCDVCGKVLSEHQFGDWQDGETRRSRTCTICGFTESESLEQNANVNVSFDPAAFGAESAAAVTIKVEEMSADKTEVIAVQEKVIAAAENKEAVVFDVTALVNDVAKHQLENGYEVLVKIAIPEGYSNPEVYYIDENGNTEKLESWIEGDYVCFYTTHFSAYAVVGDVEPESGIVSYLKKIDFLHFGDWLASFHEFLRTLDFLGVFRKISGFVYYIFEGAKIIFVC